MITPSRHTRGQNLLLFALTLFLLVLMVTLTLGIAMRIRDNHEAQTMADAAAFSTAVETARAYNDASIINRLQVSYWVSQAAVQSEISWTSYARAEMSAAFYAAFIDSFSCNFLGMIDVFIAIYNSVILNNLSEWTTMDMAAGDEAREIQGRIAGLRDEIQSQTFDTLQGHIMSQKLPNMINASSGAVGTSVIAGGPENVTMNETMCAGGGIGSSGLGFCRGGGWSRMMVDAAMGTRLDPFLTSRGVAPNLIDDIWTNLRNASNRAVDVVSVPPTGSGYWSFMSGSPTHGNNPDGTRAWADDHGSVNVTLRGPIPGLFGLFPWLGSACPASNSFPIITWVKSTEIEDNSDSHVIIPDGVSGSINDIPDVHHTMGSCAPYCPSVWVSTFDFVSTNSDDDAWGQPKSYVAIERDYSAVKRPWDLVFNFKLDKSASGADFDNRGRKLMNPFNRGLDISHAVALSSGMAYYHRKGQRGGVDLWQESPNMLNPYWRATLVPADIDDLGDPDGPTATGDMATALGGPTHKWQLDTYKELVNQGFRGLH